MPLIDVVPAGFVSVAEALGAEIPGRMESAYLDLSIGLGSLAGMAGDDPSGAAWGSGYDASAGALVHGLNQATNASLHVASMLYRTAVNLDLAEAASSAQVSTLVPHVADTDRLTWGVVASAVGAGNGSLGQPTGWSLICGLLARVWPNGHQDQLRQAAQLWRDIGRRVSAVAWDAGAAIASLAGQVTPELDDMVTVCSAVQVAFTSIGAQCSALAQACDDYAARIDQARSQVEHELAVLAGQTVAIEGAGAVASFFSFGLAEVPTQLLEASRLADAAATVGRLLAELDAWISSVAVGAMAIVGRVGVQVAADVEPILIRQLESAILDQIVLPTDGAAITGSLTLATEDLEFASSPIGTTEQTWGNSAELPRHLLSHGKDFALTDRDKYAYEAQVFVRRALLERLPMKIDYSTSTLRFWDRAGQVFGSFRFDGRTRSFYVATSRTYWERQPGRLFNE